MNAEQLKVIENKRRTLHLKSAKPQEFIKNRIKKDKLHIVYVMTWTEVCGGSKITLEHANRLVLKGQDVTIISHYEKPAWFNLNEAISFIQVPYDEVLGEKIPSCDVIVANYWKEVYECIEQNIAPVVYFEQGDAHLFAPETVDEETTDYIKRQFEVASFIFTVSNYAKGKIKERFNKDAVVISNAIDNDIFYPKSHNKFENKNDISIALIGSIDWEFKCIGNILKAIDILKDSGYDIKVNWISRTEPIDSRYKAIVNPEQSVIGDVLRESDIYICASRYESFCLPVLEAMSCGTVVITTDNGGIRDWVVENDNALIIEKDNVEDIVNKVKLLIHDNELREKLSKNAVMTSKKFSWENTTNKLLDYYKDIASYSVKQSLDVNMRFSIIIPAYNVEKYVKCSIESVLKQTYKNYELIVIDDCSTDSTADIIKQYESDIVFIQHEKNEGVSKARNAGIDRATGEYIIFLDPDDCLKSDDVLEKIDSLIGSSNLDIVFLGFEFKHSKQVVISTLEQRKSLEYSMLEDRLVNVWSKCWNREFLNKNNIRFIESLRYYEDVPFNVQGICLAQRFKVSDFVTHLYTDVRKDSATDKFVSCRNPRIITDIFGYISELIKLTEIVSKEAKDILFKLIRRAIIESEKWVSNWENQV